MGLFLSRRTQNVNRWRKTVPSCPHCAIAATRAPTRCNRPPPLLGDTETGSAPDNYNGSNSGRDEGVNLADDDDSDLEEQSAGQHEDIGNYLPEHSGLQLGEDSENEDEGNEGDVNITAMMGPQAHRLREIAAPWYGISSQKEGEPLSEASGKKGKGNTTSLDPNI